MCFRKFSYVVPGLFVRCSCVFPMVVLYVSKVSLCFLYVWCKVFLCCSCVCPTFSLDLSDDVSEISFTGYFPVLVPIMFQLFPDRFRIVFKLCLIGLSNLHIVCLRDYRFSMFILGCSYVVYLLCVCLCLILFLWFPNGGPDGISYVFLMLPLCVCSCVVHMVFLWSSYVVPMIL